MALITQATADKCATRELGGVRVIDTPLIRAAEAYALEHSNPSVFKHIMRSWLYGVLLIQANEELSANVDLEIHAVSSILHDLGWDQTSDSTLITPDRRFEVDGAFAARDFIKSHADGEGWDDKRLQLVWDAIALHATPSIANFKEVDVSTVSQGIGLDFFGAMRGVKPEDYSKVSAAFPKDDMMDGVNGAITWLCHTKPNSTYGKHPYTLNCKRRSSDTDERDIGQTPGCSLGVRI